MVCIYCGSSTEVINSRQKKIGNSVWRRRRCKSCNCLFTTRETAREDKAFMLRKPDGNLVAFSRDKLFLSIHDCCRHRSGASNDATALTATVMGKLILSHKESVLEISNLIEVAFKVLNSFDKVASTHYRAFYMKSV